MRRAAILALFWLVPGCPYDGRDPATTDAPAIDGPGNVIADAGADASGVVGWAIHTAGDFLDPGVDPSAPADFRNLTASSHDVLEPIAYEINGVLGRGANTRLFDTAGEPWSTLAGATANAAMTIDDPTGDFTDAFPLGVGIDAGDTYTAWWEGEVFLESGNHNLFVQADDFGFVEIDLPAGTMRAQDDSVLPGAPIVLVVGADGYYPFRAALAEQGGTSQLMIFHQAPGQLGFGTMTRSRLRARGDALTGVLRHGFDAKQLGAPGGATIATGVLFAEAYGGGFPPDVGITDHDTWSQRLAGQAWLDQPGMYALQVTCEAGYRVVVDGALLSDPARFDDVAHDDTVAVPETLARGWHDVAIDHQDQTGNTDLAVQLVAPSPVTGTIAANDLRPVSTGRERIAYGVAPPGPVLIDGTRSATINAGRLTDLVEMSVMYQIDHPAWQELVVTLRSPWGATAVIRDHEAQSGNGDQIVTALVPASLLAVNGGGTRPITGSWAIDVEDTTGAAGGMLLAMSLTARYTGGAPSIAPAGRYVTGVHDFGAARAVSGLTVLASTPTGTVATVAMRTCDALPCTGPFMATDAMSFPLPAARYVQLQIDGTSDGIATWFVDDIDVYVQP